MNLTLRRVGQRTLDDATLVEFIQHFDGIPLHTDAFEFPDLLGAAYEYLIKYFADSAGKKGGEFYTPSEVALPLALIIAPRAGMAVYDPTAGAGGLLIQSKGQVEEAGGDVRNLALFGQELNGGTWAICGHVFGAVGEVVWAWADRFDTGLDAPTVTGELDDARAGAAADDPVRLGVSPEAGKVKAGTVLASRGGNGTERMIASVGGWPIAVSLL